MAVAAMALFLCAGCSTTSDFLTRMRLVNVLPWANTPEALETHRDSCLADYGLENKRQMEAASPEIQSAYLYCLRNTDGWYLVEERQYDAEIARINRDYYNGRQTRQASTL